MKLSILICTYNPSDEVFRKCLDALSDSLGQQPAHEILLIDNNSTVRLQDREYVSDLLRKHPNARVINEQKQGLTPARLRGIRESSGDLLVFIDDDNLIRADFLSEAGIIAESYPFIGSYSGQVEIVPQSNPPEWTKKYWGMLVHRLFTGNHWGNQSFDSEIMPCGAGLCVRRNVALYYHDLHVQGKRNMQLDRTTNSLLSGGDNDLAMCACDLGMGMGIFESLYVYHHLPANRFSLDYLSKLAHGIYFSTAMLKFMRTGRTEKFSARQRAKSILLAAFQRREDLVITRSWIRGLKDAEKQIKLS